MKPPPGITAGLLMVAMWLAGGTGIASDGQTSKSVDQSLAAGQAALRQKHHAEAIRPLQDALKRFPADRRLRVELGRTYLYDHQDDRAIRLFREVLREDPSNRPAKLGVARALNCHRDYAASNQLYRELLKANPDDDGTAVGLAHNLTNQKHTGEARPQLGRDLAPHPNSPRLRKAQNRPEKNKRRARPRYPRTPPNATGERGRVRPRYPRTPPNAQPSWEWSEH